MWVWGEVGLQFPGGEQPSNLSFLFNIPRETTGLLVPLLANLQSQQHLSRTDINFVLRDSKVWKDIEGRTFVH